MVDGEDQVIVMGGQLPYFLFFQPLGFLERATLWALSIFTWIVGDLGLPAFLTGSDMASQGSRPASQDVVDHASLHIGVAVLLQIRLFEFPEHLCDFMLRSLPLVLPHILHVPMLRSPTGLASSG